MSKEEEFLKIAADAFVKQGADFLAFLVRLFSIALAGSSIYALGAAVSRAKSFKREVDNLIRGSSFKLLGTVPSAATFRYSELLTLPQQELGISVPPSKVEAHETIKEAIDYSSLTPWEKTIYDFLAENPVSWAFIPIFLIGIPALTASTIYKIVSKSVKRSILTQAQEELAQAQAEFYTKFQQKFKKQAFWRPATKALHILLGMAAALSFLTFLAAVPVFDKFFAGSKNIDQDEALEEIAKHILATKVPTPFPVQFSTGFQKYKGKYFKSLEELEAEST